ncbi:putative retrograde regulation protein 2 [Coleophoma cylindrospora]|uniref:Putative retrograde regulation protein 2 n=1 Tax=Coleophoma cylindrospora TaxID=1849047 RepID=A0A3D8SFX9_9HELO|nr:putative retrograde regulation protein 2 [Coleophoma cylindrospora]
MAAETDNVITIHNFASKMSTFDPNSTGKQLYGLVDMGSNGIRFSISDLSEPRSRLLDCMYKERAGISLYDALHESAPDSKAFHFSQKTITQVAKTLSRFKRICDSHGVAGKNISVFATEAMRTAENRDEMLDAIHKESGLVVDILSPEMESLFGAMGARSGFNQVDGLFMDLGGGSVQMTYVDSSTGAGYDVLAAQAAKSLPFGAAKLTAALSTRSTAAEAKVELQGRMKQTFEGMKSQFPKLKEQIEKDGGVSIYFCGGGFRGYGSMLMHTETIQPYPIPAIGGYSVSGDRFVKWKQMLKANDYDGKIYGMSKRRREQFPAIVEVVHALVEAVPKIKQVTFCSGGNREGVLYMKLPTKMRESNPLPMLPGVTYGAIADDATIASVVERLSLALPGSQPSVFSPELLDHIARNIWVHTGDSDDANSARSLHHPISGSLAGLPGLTHQIQAVLALTMCARWGADLGPVDRPLQNNLKELIGAELSFWCEFIGTIARAMAIVIPDFPREGLSSGPDRDAVLFKSDVAHGLGKKGHKSGIKLQIAVAKQSQEGIDLGKLEDMFSKVGKGLHLGWTVEAEVV